MNPPNSQRNSDFLKMHRLQNLLWMSEQYDSCGDGNSLPECFGDSYLYANNMLCTRVRKLFFALGFKYTADPLFCRDYFAAPLLCLPGILGSKFVPFFDNTSVLRQVLLRCPELTISTHDLQMQLKRNYLLHESCHCVADAVLARFQEKNKNTPVKNTPEEAFVITALVCESFANVVERLAAVLADFYPHNLFFHLNSYVEYQAQKTRLIKDAIAIFGIENILRFGFLGYFFSNLRPGSPDDAICEGFTSAVFKDVSLTASEQSILRLLAENAFVINGTFREETTALFFRMFHCEEQFRQIAKIELTFDALQKIGVFDYMDQLVSTLMSQPESAVAAFVNDQVTKS
jgi:hypothetical protein